MRALGLPDWLPTPSHHLLVVVVALLVYLVNARARRERRAPAAAITWVMGLMLLPYLMLPLYLAFGQRKRPARLAPQATERTTAGHWAAELLGSFGLAAPSAAQVRFHADGEASLSALLELIGRARQRLDVCTFLIGPDHCGRDVLSHLAARARQGVAVRLMIDGLSAWQAPRAELRELKAAGAQVAVFHPLWQLRRTGPRNLRNHRKLVIADGERLWAGGRNFAAEYFTGHGTLAPWLDLSFDLQGEVAAVAARQFEADWMDAPGPRAPADSPAPCNATPPEAGSHDAAAQFLPSGPDQTEDTAHALLIAAAFHARRRLLIATPYFVPDVSLQDALRLAVRRGVQVTLVIPEKSNHGLADFVRARPLRELAQAGADIRLLPRMSHAKAVVIDDSIALCGSINLDSRSLLLNYESAVVFYGSPQIAWLSRWIEARAEESRPFVATPPGLLRDLAEGALLAVAFQI